MIGVLLASVTKSKLPSPKPRSARGRWRGNGERKRRFAIRHGYITHIPSVFGEKDTRATIRYMGLSV